MSDVRCSFDCRDPLCPRLDFSRFNGTVVLASSHVRKCAKCKRMIGRGRGYSYGHGRRRVDVCSKCHKRNFRRYERRRALTPPGGKR